MGKKNRNKKQVNQVPAVESESKMDFDTWHAIRKDLIPAHHYKEIIKADFYARGLDDEETQESFDKALKLYGIKL